VLLNFLEFSLVINLALRIMWILCWLSVLNVCIYELKLLKSTGLPPKQLQTVF